MYSKKIATARLQKVQEEIAYRLGKPFEFREHTPIEIKAFNDRMAKVYDAQGGLTRELTEEEVLFITNEIELVKWDFRYFCERYVVISSDQGRLAPLRLRNAQEKLLRKWGELEESRRPYGLGKVALACVKARRVGATALGQAAIAHGVMLRGHAFGLCASDIPENTLKLFDIQERIYNHLPVWMKPAVTGKVKNEHMHFAGLDSDLGFGTGNQKNPMGQGQRLDFIHFTEASTWADVGVEQIDEDVEPAFASSRVPSSLWFIESTGKSSVVSGKWFENFYKQARDGNTEFRAVFLSWFDAPEVWSMDASGLEFTETTKGMAYRVRRDYGVELTREQMAFYQIKREAFEAMGNLDVFLQEWPTSEDECFQSGLRSVFPIEVRDRVAREAKPVLFAADVNPKTGKLIRPFHIPYTDGPIKSPVGRVIVWERRRPGFQYVVGVDVSYGIEGKDTSAVFVNRVGNRKEPDEQVAEFSGFVPPDDLAHICKTIGEMYTDEDGLPALMAIEINPGSPGLITQMELRKLGYPNFYVDKYINALKDGYKNALGWHTTPSTRPLLTKAGVKAIREGHLKINSPYFLEEMRTFVDYGTKRGVNYLEHFEHAPDEHDDRIMAGFIAFYVSHESDMQNVADERMRLQHQKVLELGAKAGVAPVRDYQNTAGYYDEGGEPHVMTWERAREDFENRLGDLGLGGE